MKKRKHAKGAGRRPGKGISAYKPDDHFHNELVATWGDLAESPAGIFQQFFVDWEGGLERSIYDWPNIRTRLAAALAEEGAVGIEAALESCDDREIECIKFHYLLYSKLLISRLIQRDARFFRELAAIIGSPSLTKKGGKQADDPLRKHILARVSEVRRSYPNQELRFSATKMQQWLRDEHRYEVADLQTLREAMRALGIPLNSKRGRSENSY